MDTCSSHFDNEVNEVLSDFMKRITMMYRKAIHFENIESNMSYLTANRFAEISRLISQHNVRIESRDPKGKGRDGVWTGEHEKMMYSSSILNALSSMSLCYADDSSFISRDPVKTREKFEKQLATFRRITSANPNPAFKKTKVTFSGEGKDDLVIVCGMCLYFSYLKRNSEEYHEMAQSAGFVS